MHRNIQVMFTLVLRATTATTHKIHNVLGPFPKSYTDVDNPVSSRLTYLGGS